MASTGGEEKGVRRWRRRVRSRVMDGRLGLFGLGKGCMDMGLSLDEQLSPIRG